MLIFLVKMNEGSMTEAEARAVLDKDAERLKKQYEYQERWAQKTHGCSFYEYTDRRRRAKLAQRNAAREKLGLPPLRRGPKRKWAPRIPVEGGVK